MKNKSCISVYYCVDVLCFSLL